MIHSPARLTNCTTFQVENYFNHDLFSRSALLGWDRTGLADSGSVRHLTFAKPLSLFKMQRCCNLPIFVVLNVKKKQICFSIPRYSSLSYDTVVFSLFVIKSTVSVESRLPLKRVNKMTAIQLISKQNVGGVDGT